MTVFELRDGAVILENIRTVHLDSRHTCLVVDGVSFVYDQSHECELDYYRLLDAVRGVSK